MGDGEGGDRFYKHPAVAHDQQVAGWVYGGGSYVEPGKSVQLVVELDPGEWNVVASPSAKV